MRLKELRLQRNETQNAIANKIGCSVSCYAKYERGEREPDIYTLKKMSRFFCVSIDYLVEND